MQHYGERKQIKFYYKSNLSRYQERRNAAIKKILFCSVAACFLAANLFTINMGAFQLSLYRVALLASILFLCLTAFAGGPTLRLASADDGTKKKLGKPLKPLLHSLYQRKPQRNALSAGYPFWFMIFWFLWAAASVLWVKDLSMWAKALYFLGTGTFWTVCYSLFFKTERDFKLIFFLMQGMILFVSMIGWYEVVTKDYRFIEMTPANIHAYVDAPARVPIALSGNPNDFALLVLFGIFIGFVCFQASASLPGKAVSLLCMASSAALLYFTESRANWLGLVLGLGVFVLLSFRDKKRVILLVLLGGTALAAFLASPYFWTALEKISHIMQFNFHSGEYNSESVRVNLILNGLYFLTETFWVGTGAGNIEHWMAHDTIVNTNGYVNIHNWWVEILASYGLVFFLLYLAFYAVLAYRMYRKVKTAETKFERSASLGLLCCMAAFVIGSISSSSNMKTEWLWVFWAVAIVFSGCRFSVQTKENEEERGGELLAWKSSAYAGGRFVPEKAGRAVSAYIKQDQNGKGSGMIR